MNIIEKTERGTFKKIHAYAIVDESGRLKYGCECVANSSNTLKIIDKIPEYQDEKFYKFVEPVTIIKGHSCIL